jgi:beta-galactosidase
MFHPQIFINYAAAGIKPHTKATLKIKDLKTDVSGEAYVQLSFKLKDSTNWAKSGAEVAWGQLQITKPASLEQIRSLYTPPSNTRPKIEQIATSRLVITSATGSSTWEIDLSLGALSSWKRSARPHVELLTQPLIMDFFRAVTDNDRYYFGKQWVDARVHQTKHHVRQVEWTETSDGLEVVIRGRIAPPVLAWGVDTISTFVVRGDTLSLKIKGKPHGLLLPTTFARIGMTTGIKGVEQVQWWGRGPGESYSDKKQSQAFGNWKESVDDLFVDYEFPQETGNRTDVRWVEFLGHAEDQTDAANGEKKYERLLRARFGDFDGASFTALHYTTADLDECTHPYELHKRKRSDTIIRLDWVHHGIGTGSCGPVTLPQYALKTDKEFEFELILD